MFGLVYDVFGHAYIMVYKSLYRLWSFFTHLRTHKTSLDKNLLLLVS
jgi:hypothetical protein